MSMRPLARALAVGLLLLLPTAAHAQQTKWYLAEGSTGPFFREDVLAVNPTNQVAIGVVRIFKNGGAVDVPFAIPAHRRITLPVNLVPGLETGETSALVDTSASGVPIFVERTMYWLDNRGGHNAGGVEAPSSTWYLAEGATGSFFSTFILMVNPNGSPANVTVSLMSDAGQKTDFPYVLAANSRQTIAVNQLPGFASVNFATTVSSSQPIFVERAMYWLGFEGGHDATAVPALASSWRFAEGFTGGDFDTYFLVANPGGVGGTLTLDFFLDSGGTVTKTLAIGATSRVTVRARDYAELQNAAFATRISSTVPIVAERAMYWGGFAEGHATAGLTQEEGSWVFAEGLAGTHDGQSFETFYLFLNPSNAAIDVTGTFYREDGYGTQQTYTLPPNSRFTLYGAAVPHMNGSKFGAVFQASAPFIVERAVYWGAGRLGGHVSTGARWTGAVAVPETPPTAVAPPPPPPPPACTAVLCDSLAGSTSGRQYGGGFDSFGYVVTDDRAGIEWTVPTITKGYFEFELTSMRMAQSDDKYKIFAMYDRDWDSGNLYRATVEQRLPPRFSRLKFLAGSGVHGDYIESDVVVPWNPADTYKVRLEWGDGRARFIVTSLTSGGQWVLDEDHAGGLVYAPALHRIAIGNPDAGGGDHGSFPGMRIRNVRIGTR
jgi:hypothetical protein